MAVCSGDVCEKPGEAPQGDQLEKGITSFLLLFHFWQDLGAMWGSWLDKFKSMWPRAPVSHNGRPSQ